MRLLRFGEYYLSLDTKRGKMETCSVCGRPYGVTHSCPGPPSRVPNSTWPIPTTFAPVQYFRQAIAIARFDEAAIISASFDRRSILYGAAIWLLGQFLIFGHVLWAAAHSQRAIRLPAVAVGSCVLIMADAVWLLAQYGFCHILARWLFGAHGTYVRLLRPLLLGSIVTWLLIVPYVGTLVAGFWSIAIMMLVFENVDGIERLKAFGLSSVVGILFLGLAHSLLHFP
jgi:hypothetical protein